MPPAACRSQRRAPLRTSSRPATAVRSQTAPRPAQDQFPGPQMIRHGVLQRSFFGKHSTFCQLIEEGWKYAYKCRMDLLTTSEAADYLRLGERKLYELVAAGSIPCSKVTGKWLFPRHELDVWVLSGLARPPGISPAEPPPIVGGSQDDLLEWS